MIRQEVLFYISNGKIYFYITKNKKEIIEEVDTSLFFKFGEISDVEKCSDIINDIINKRKILNGILKPKVLVLYNDIANCDLKYLYKGALSPLNFSEIKFMAITDIIKRFKNYKKIILFDKDYYTFFYNRIKTFEIDDIETDYIFVGNGKENEKHFSDNDLIWNTFKSDFTKK